MRLACALFLCGLPAGAATIVYSVSNVESSAAYYNAVGLKPSGAGKFEIPGETFRLELVRGAKMHGPKARIQDPGAPRLVLSVRDVNQALAASNRAGGTVLTPGGSLVPFRGATKGIAVRDPDGLIIELVQFDPLPSTSAPLTSNVIGGRISLSVGNLEKTVAFYRDVLGFEVMAPTTLGPNENVMKLFDAVGGEWRYAMATLPGESTQWEFAEFRNLERKPFHGRVSFALKAKPRGKSVRDPDGVLLKYE